MALETHACTMRHKAITKDRTRPDLNTQSRSVQLQQMNWENNTATVWSQPKLQDVQLPLLNPERKDDAIHYTLFISTLVFVAQLYVKCCSSRCNHTLKEWDDLCCSDIKKIFIMSTMFEVNSRTWNPTEKWLFYVYFSNPQPLALHA